MARFALTLLLSGCLKQGNVEGFTYDDKNFNIPTNEVGPSVFLGLNYPDFTIHYSCDAPERK